MRIFKQRNIISYLRCSRGVAAIEFAICCPLLIVLLLGGVEISYLAMTEQKAQKAASALADLSTQGSSISRSTLNQLAGSMKVMMKPVTFKGTVIFSSAAHFSTTSAPCPANQPCIKWQYRPVGTDNSKIGAVGTVPSLPSKYQVLVNQDVIVVELFIEYQPILGASAVLMSAFSPRTLYYTALYKPRQGTLTTLN